MCGIVFCSGELPEGRTGPDSVFESARDLMTSRGPDGSGSVTLTDSLAGPIRLGHRRLAIVDTSDAGTQPMWSDCRRFVIVYNGEVYNADELRTELRACGRRFMSASDTEVIVNGFAEWGEEIVERSFGMFAFAIWDTQRGRLFAARDRLGIKPLYVSENSGRLALASDLRVLERLGFAGKIDNDALAAYLMLGYVPTPMAILSGVHKLEAGQALSWAPQTGCRFRKYWNPPAEISSSEMPDVDALGHLIDKVTQDHLMADVPIGVFLSGGLDSSLIASSLAALKTDVQALTIGYSDSPGEDEAPIAERTARHLGMNIERLDLNRDSTAKYIDSAFAALDEPLGFSAIVSQMAISKAAHEAGLKVVLSGDGGDEVFGGYRWYDPKIRSALLDPSETFVSQLFRRFNGPLRSLIPQRYNIRSGDNSFIRRSELHLHLRAVFPTLKPDEVGDIMTDLSPNGAEELAIESLRRHDVPELPLKRRLQRIDLMTFCEGSVLPKVDRTSMATGLEVRPPLLDHRVVEWGLSQPISKTMDQEPKNAVRSILRNRGLEFLLNEKKRGFSLKGISQLSGKNMLNDLWSHGEDRRLFNAASRMRLEPDSYGYKMKVQSLYFFDRWTRERAKEIS